jgi:hypothetical protein
VAVKRQAAPAGRQGNDGWRSVLYEGGPLERVRKAYAAQFAPAADDVDEVTGRITFNAFSPDDAIALCEAEVCTDPSKLQTRRTVRCSQHFTKLA